jgi:hypothetical protein
MLHLVRSTSGAVMKRREVGRWGQGACVRLRGEFQLWGIEFQAPALAVESRRLAQPCLRHGMERALPDLA